MISTEIIAAIMFLIPTFYVFRFAIKVAVKQNGGPTKEYLKLVRVWESIAILFGAPRPTPPPVKKTLDDRGISLWEASDEFYDQNKLDQIRRSHGLEHKLWLNWAGEHHWANNEERKLVGLPIKRTAEENIRLGIISADHIYIRNWNGDVAWEIRDAEDDETLLAYDCDNHSRKETCYYCDPDSLHNIKPKRQRRKQ